MSVCVFGGNHVFGIAFSQIARRNRVDMPAAVSQGTQKFSQLVCLLHAKSSNTDFNSMQIVQNNRRLTMEKGHVHQLLKCGAIRVAG